MTILMMIQPDVLSSVMGNSAFRGRGLTARFLYSLPESRVGSRNVNPASVPPEVRKAYEDFVLELLQEKLPDTPEEITLSEEAEQARITFAEDLERRLLGDLTDIRDWAGKLEGNTMRIAGLICRAEAGPDGRIQPENPEEAPHYEITGRQMFNAIRIANYYVELRQDRTGVYNRRIRTKPLTMKLPAGRCSMQFALRIITLSTQKPPTGKWALKC